MKSRKSYEFSKAQRKERLEGCDFTCEGCGKKTKSLQVHHLIACHLAIRNPVLTPAVIRVIENEMCLCHACHLKADRDQKNWTPHDIAMIAWALFDLDPEKVEKAQNGTYKEKGTQIITKKTRRKQNKIRRRKRRRR